MKIYISGPISGIARPVYRAAFYDAAAVVESRSMTAVNPLDLRPPKECGCLIGELGDHAWSCYLKRDLIGMLHADAIGLLPGWERSHGAKLEFQVAIATGMKVAHFIPVKGDISPQALLYTIKWFVQ